MGAENGRDEPPRDEGAEYGAEHEVVGEMGTRRQGKAGARERSGLT